MPVSLFDGFIFLSFDLLTSCVILEFFFKKNKNVFANKIQLTAVMKNNFFLIQDALIHFCEYSMITLLSLNKMGIEI